MQAARRWGVIWPAALAGLVGGAAAGFVAAPDVIAEPGLLALSGMALGLLLGLPAVWRRASGPAAQAVVVDRHVAEESPPWRLAPSPAGRDPAPAGTPIRVIAAPSTTGTQTSGPSTCGRTAGRDEGE